MNRLVRRRLFSLLLGTFVAAAIVLPARPVGLVADLSSYLVAITTGFSGEDVLFFGAVDGPGDVVVVLRGPDGEQQVLRKSRVAGIWMNTARMSFRQVPSYYAVASTRPIEEIADRAVLRSLEIGLSNLRLALPAAIASANIADEWRAALIRNKQAQGLFARELAKVTLRDERLFRTSFYLPPTVPVGYYQAQVYLFRGGQAVSAQTIPLSVSKVGLEADVFLFAHRRPSLYGLVAVIFALLAGWIAHAVFRRN
ncbi:MAG: TIGR02186 family protein [Tistlia sp.]|uniref:TIGR02186 family protein n=1 Tax=Tistlia sp. TaxID=3057121 RepID=UPI0034A2D4BA